MSEAEDQQTIPNRYVHWKEGADLLEISRGSFFYLVESGQVKKRKGKNSRDGRYSLADILKIKKTRETGRPRKPYPKKLADVRYDWISARDIPACLRLDQLVYDKMLLAQAAQYEQWVSHNPFIAMAAFDARDRNTCLAYVSILPLPESIIIDVLADRRDELSIQAHEIERYDRPGAYTLLVNSAVRHPDRPDLLFSTISRIMTTWLEWYPERFIRRVYAQAYSNEGDKLIQYFFMSPLYHLAPNAYMLDMVRPGMSRPIRKFQAALAAKAPLPIEIEPTYTPTVPPLLTPIVEKVTQARITPRRYTTMRVLPDGRQSMIEAASGLGISRRRLLEILVNEDNKHLTGLVINERNGLQHYATPKGTRNEMERTLTPEQIEMVRSWRVQSGD